MNRFQIDLRSISARFIVREIRGIRKIDLRSIRNRSDEFVRSILKSISDDISSAHPKKVVYDDDEYGNFLPGMRVQWEKWRPTPPAAPCSHLQYPPPPAELVAEAAARPKAVGLVLGKHPAFPEQARRPAFHRSNRLLQFPTSPAELGDSRLCTLCCCLTRSARNHPRHHGPQEEMLRDLLAYADRPPSVSRVF
jgi:hypothetical protein